jgi:hypothetical protein
MSSDTGTINFEIWAQGFKNFADSSQSGNESFDPLVPIVIETDRLAPRPDFPRMARRVNLQLDRRPTDSCSGGKDHGSKPRSKRV